MEGTVLPATVFASLRLHRDQKNFDAAVATGQSPPEILFHEIAHAYLNFAFPGLLPNTIYTANNGIYTISYNTADPSAVDAYGHGLIADYIQSAFGSDGTGATMEAFGYNPNTNPPSEVAGVTVSTANGPVDPAVEMKAITSSKGTPFAMPKSPASTFAQAMANQGQICSPTLQVSPIMVPQDTRSTAPGFFEKGATYVP